VSRMNITRQEIRFALLVTAGVLILGSLPYAFGYLSAPPDQVFMGIALGTPDTNQYFAWMRAFTRAPLISNTLTPEPNEAVFFNLLWWLLAQMARLGLSHIVIFHVLRVVAGLAFLLAAYFICALFLKEPAYRKTAFLVVALGAGLGWLLVVGKYLTGRLTHPLDVYIVEPNSFLAMMAFPHFSFAAALILAVFGLMLLGYERRQWRYPLIASAVSFLLGWSHAYDLLLIYAVVGVFTLIVWVRDGWSWRLLLYPLALVLLSCAPALYSVYITSAFPVWRDVLAQFVNADAWTPDPFRLLIVMGVPFILALFTFDGLVPLRERSLRELFVKTWFGVTLFVAYLPVSYQIHYLNGWQVPIAILATAGLYQRVIPWLAGARSGRRVGRRLALFLAALRPERWAPALLLLAVIPTNLYLLAWRFVDLNRHQSPYYLYRDEVAALEWLEANAAPEDVVLSGIEVGQYIPSIAGNRAFLAHWAMTADVYAKQEMVERFFAADTPDVERQAILRQFGVRYVFFGAEERGLGGQDLNGLPYLQQVFDAERAAVYRVEWDDEG
jgi:hypothetical protein